MTKPSFLFLFLFLFHINTFAVERKINSVTCNTSKCHDNLMHSPIMHGPMKSKGCTVCHEVNADQPSKENKHPILLKIVRENINTTCRVCHDEMTQGKFKYAHGVIEKKSCVECHNPHGSDQPHLLQQRLPDLCIKCHEGKKSILKFGHNTIYSTTKSCLNCHEAHFANQDNLLSAPLRDACMKCHDKEQKSPKGATVAAIGQFLKNRANIHKPITDGKCSACHDPHGSEFEAFLMDDITPPGFPLCASCHKKPLFQEKITTTATQFRNGSTNLHFLHLENKKNGQQTCATCHDSHASNQAHLIHDEKEKFGWNQPIVFKQTPNGGTCTSACHGDKPYDRAAVVP